MMQQLELMYRQAMADRLLEQDASQLELVALLATYMDALEGERFPLNRISSLFARCVGRKSALKRGVYIWGRSGRGKSMILQLFFESLCGVSKKYQHFHQFMGEFHMSMLQESGKNPQRRRGIVNMLAKEVASKSKVICLDELQINNIADAMVIYQLVAELLKRSAFIFLTSNFMPEDLFKDGLQRERFLPFIELVQSRLDVYNLDNQSDYRLDKLLAAQKCYYWPQELGVVEPCYETVIEIDHNRRISVAKSSGNTAIFSFKELCAGFFGALDYLAICRRFDVLILTHLRAMELEDHNELLRFITLIDCIYENKVKLICFAAVPIDALYSGARYEVEFRRAVSRLHEMQSAQYDLEFRNRHGNIAYLPSQLAHSS